MFFKPLNKQDESTYIKSLQRWMNTALFDLDSNLGRSVNVIGMVVIVCSVVLSMIGTLDFISDTARRAIEIIEITVTLMFALEYFLRLLCANRPFAYAFSFYGLIDLLAWLPMLFVGNVNLAIRLLRIMRLLKLIRYLRALHLFLSSMQDTIDIMLVVVSAIIIIVLVTGNMIHAVEPATFSNAFIGSWWSLVTMTTVGYGDIVPHTGAGKLIAAVLMLTGITMFAMLTATISVKIATVLNRDHECSACHQRISHEFYFCPYCGTEQDDKLWLKCRHCHHQINKQDRFCASCGKQQ